MAFRLSLFKTPKHRVFHYKPRYYDPQEERRQELRSLSGDEGLVGEENITRHLRSRMHREFQHEAYHNRKKAGSQKLVRIIIIVTFAALLFALFYFAKMMEVLMSSL